jgi:hypothetical protein
VVNAACMPMRTFVPSVEREQRPDRLAELLECLADLLVETRKQRTEIAQQLDTDDPRAPEAIARLAEMERSLGDVAVEAASVHQRLQHLHLI